VTASSPLSARSLGWADSPRTSRASSSPAAVSCLATRPAATCTTSTPPPAERSASLVARRSCGRSGLGLSAARRPSTRSTRWPPRTSSPAAACSVRCTVAVWCRASTTRAPASRPSTSASPSERPSTQATRGGSRCRRTCGATSRGSATRTATAPTASTSRSPGLGCRRCTPTSRGARRVSARTWPVASRSVCRASPATPTGRTCTSVLVASARCPSSAGGQGAGLQALEFLVAHPQAWLICRAVSRAPCPASTPRSGSTP
jgi:hypothetical protein